MRDRDRPENTFTQFLAHYSPREPATKARVALRTAQRAHVNGFLQIKELIGLHIRPSPPRSACVFRFFWLCKADISRINMGAYASDVSLHFHSSVAIGRSIFFLGLRSISARFWTNKYMSPFPSKSNQHGIKMTIVKSHARDTRTIRTN